MWACNRNFITECKAQHSALCWNVLFRNSRFRVNRGFCGQRLVPRMPHIHSFSCQELSPLRSFLIKLDTTPPWSPSVRSLKCWGLRSADMAWPYACQLQATTYFVILSVQYILSLPSVRYFIARVCYVLYCNRADGKWQAILVIMFLCIRVAVLLSFKENSSPSVNIVSRKHLPEPHSWVRSISSYLKGLGVQISDRWSIALTRVFVITYYLQAELSLDIKLGHCSSFSNHPLSWYGLHE
jgi:hypothetical protein